MYDVTFRIYYWNTVGQPAAHKWMVLASISKMNFSLYWTMNVCFIFILTHLAQAFEDRKSVGFAMQQVLAVLSILFYTSWINSNKF